MPGLKKHLLMGAGAGFIGVILAVIPQIAFAQWWEDEGAYAEYEEGFGEEEQAFGKEGFGEEEEGGLFGGREEDLGAYYGDDFEEEEGWGDWL